MELWKLNSCPKCKGALFIDRDNYGKYLTCSSCGWCKDLAESSQLPRSRIDEDADREGVPDGCNVSPSCFSCPLPECMWEQPITRKAYLRDVKTLEVFKQHQHLGTAQAAQAAAEQMRLTERSVYRMLKRTNPPGRKRPEG
jgi:hypothetical protein